MNTLENRRRFLTMGSDPVRTQTQQAMAASAATLAAGGTPVFDVTNYGAIPASPSPALNVNGMTDCSVQVQNAMNAAAAVNGLVYFPAGQYRVANITAPGNVSICGDGQATVLRVDNKSNGLVVQSSGAEGGGRRISDLTIIGSDFGVGLWVQGGKGILFQNLFVSHFTWGVRCEHLKASELLSVITNFCYHGVTIFGYSENIYIGACKIQRGPAPSGPEGSFGIYVESYGGGTPKHIRVGAGTLVTGHGYGVVAANVEDFGVHACTLDAFIHYGFLAMNASKGCRITDTFVASSGVVPFSAICVADGGANNNDLFVIERNSISLKNKGVDCNGIWVSEGRNGLKTIRDNHIVDMGKCIVLLGVSNTVVEGNYLSGRDAVFTQSPAKNNVFRDNNFLGGITRYDGATDVFENNRGSITTCFHGMVAIPAGMPPGLPAAGGAPTHVVALTTLLASQGNYNQPIMRGGSAYFNVHVKGFQCVGDLSRGRVRAFYDYASNVNVQFDVPFGAAIADIWVDVDVS